MTLHEYATMIFNDHYGEGQWDEKKLNTRTDEDICSQLQKVFWYYKSSSDALKEVNKITRRIFWTDQMGR